MTELPPRHEKNKIWKTDPEFVALREKIGERKIVGIPDDRCYVLMQAAKSLTVDGDIVECGCRHGKSTYVLASMLPNRMVEVFDSFKGLSEPSEKDGEHWKKGDCAAEREVFFRNMEEFSSRLLIHAGWIPETLTDIYAERIAFLHIDLDLYAPTKAALRHLYPLVVSGGLIICDDYGSTLCPGAKMAFDEFFADKPERPIGLTTAQCIVTKR